MTREELTELQSKLQSAISALQAVDADVGKLNGLHEQMGKQEDDLRDVLSKIATVHQDYQRSKAEVESAISEKNRTLQTLNVQAIEVEDQIGKARQTLAGIKEETASARDLHQQITDSLQSLRKRISAPAA